uniref:UBX domain-containing protein n=1 Tax=Kalanchoe fedtschenkoi TaxID=63787 RepID=A0A7N0TC58_KALFE
MEEVRDKMKGLMKKVTSSSSSGKFKGQGRVLGTSSSSTESILTRPTPPQSSRPKSNPTKPPPPDSKTVSGSDRKPAAADGFDPFDALVTPAKRSQNGFTMNMFECPICNQPFMTEDEVSAHVDVCVDRSLEMEGEVAGTGNGNEERGSELDVSVGTFLSGKPSDGSVEVILRLLRNVVKEPENGKFRRIRMGNLKIREAIGDVAGGVELLEAVGFGLKEEDGEMWAVMDVPTEEQKEKLNKVILLLERRSVGDMTSVPSADTDASVAQVEQRKVDRQIRVFFSVSENVAAKIELPDSFYRLSSDEVRREAEMRRKKLAESQLLIPKSYKEKQAKAARKRYARTIIRIQFPDGVVLQGIFAPWEPTTALYEFVSSALKEQTLEFELLNPLAIKRRVIPHFSAPGEKCTTLEEEDLVPSALIKFKPLETDSVVFTGLCNELLVISEPLQPGPAVS